MPNADSIDDRRSRQGPIRPLVLLVLDDDEVRARFAYQLTASGFDVAVTEVAAGLRHPVDRPDVIVAALSAARPGGGLSVGILADDPRLRGIPVVAVAGDASDTTRDLARQEGCAAMCVTTCSGATLGAGIRAVLDRSER
jgi:CheY-like chemotaxis protein